MTKAERSTRVLALCLCERGQCYCAGQFTYTGEERLTYTGVPVYETTALGAASLAAIGAGLWSGPEDVARAWSGERHFTPAMPEDVRSELLKGWEEALARTLGAAPAAALAVPT